MLVIPNSRNIPRRGKPHLASWRIFVAVLPSLIKMVIKYRSHTTPGNCDVPDMVQTDIPWLLRTVFEHFENFKTVQIGEPYDPDFSFFTLITGFAASQ